MKRIILSATVVALTAAMLALSSLASGAQEGGGQYASDGAQQDAAPSTTTTAAPQSTVICAPWSKAWDLSNGQWYYDWYRWCVDPAVYDPSIGSSWYTETGGSEWGEVANLCPEKGTCTISPDGGMRMSTSTDPSDPTEPLTTTVSSSPTPTTTTPEDTQTSTTTPEDTAQPPTTTTTTPAPTATDPSATPATTTAPEDTTQPPATGLP